MRAEQCQVLIIGAGPGGYVCAIRAAQLGLNTVIVEAEKPGGTCLNVGCIPSKALIHAADEFHKLAGFPTESVIGINAKAASIDLGKTIGWKDGIVDRLTNGVAGLLKKAGVKYVQGHAQLLDGKTATIETNNGSLKLTTEYLVIATGSRSKQLEALPFGGMVMSSTEALALTEIPKTIAVVGGGYIGLEIGTAFAKMGAEVSVVEAGPNLLPQYDAELTAPVLKRLRTLGVAIHLRAKAKGLSGDGAVLFVEVPEGELQIPAEKVLVAVGRAPVTDGFGLESLHLDMNGAHIAIDGYCATSMRGVYAIGDVTGEPMLAHRAMAQATVVAEHIAGLPSIWDKRAIPAVCFTDPEIVSVGALPDESEGMETKVFPFAANGRSMTLERDDGMVRIVYDPSNEVVYGIQAVGVGVSELSSAFALALEMGATLTDIGQTVHAHPTLSEAFQEAALMGLGQALHF